MRINSINDEKMEGFDQIDNSEEEVPKPKNNKKLIIIISLIIGIIIVGIIIFLIIFFTNEEEKNIENCLEYDKEKNICLTCISGYYLPEDEPKKIKCQKCSVENCDKCQGTTNNDTCISCSSYLTPIYVNNSINYCKYTCEEGEKEKCKTCDKRKNKCSSCNNEYFMPIDTENDKICQKCSVENCHECYGSIDNNTCVSCNEYLTPIYYNNMIKFCNYTCEEGENEKCKKCDPIKNRCSSCNSGYYLPENDEIREKCEKCSEENCDICKGQINNDICITCKPGYKLNNEGKCQINYSFKAVYRSFINKQNTELFKNDESIKLIEMSVDGKNVTPSNSYIFEEKGYHIVTVLMDLTNCSSLKEFFKETGLISISFSSYFNTINIINMDNLFYDCFYLTSIDFQI